MGLPVRTSISSLIAGAVIAGLFVTAAQRLFTVPPEAISMDAAVIRAGIPAAIYFSIFCLGHLALTQLRLSFTPTYVAIGAVAMLASFHLGGGRQLAPLAYDGGAVTLLYVVPLLWGAFLGFLYRRVAGLSTAGDEPAKLASLVAGKSPAEARRAAVVGNSSLQGFGQRNVVDAMPKVSEDAAHVSTGEAEYYDGPLQVRTSTPVVLATGVAAGAIWAVVKATLGLAFFSRVDPFGAAEAMGDTLFVPLWVASMAQTALFGIVLMPVPIYVGHLLARSRGLTGYGAYATIGAVLPIVAGVLMMGGGGILVVASFSIPCAIALACYRYFAGLEPKSLPEDIEVRDQRTLIGADHARRRYSRIVGR